MQSLNIQQLPSIDISYFKTNFSSLLIETVYSRLHLSERRILFKKTWKNKRMKQDLLRNQHLKILTYLALKITWHFYTLQHFKSKLEMLLELFSCPLKQTYKPYTLVGPTVTRPVPDPLAVLPLKNRLYMKNKKTLSLFSGYF